MSQFVDRISRHTRLQERRRQQLLPPLSSSTWSRIEIVDCPMSESPASVSNPADESLSNPAADDSLSNPAAVESSEFQSLDEETRAVLREADDLIAETANRYSSVDDGTSIVDVNRTYDETMKKLNDFSADVDRRYDEIIKELDEFSASLIVDYADINRGYDKVNRGYDKIMKELDEFSASLCREETPRRFGRRVPRKTPLRHQMMTRARRAIVFGNFPVY
jgi:hypothetical protein